MDSQYRPVEETDATAYLESSLRQGRPVCCSMIAAFAVTIDGKPWDDWQRNEVPAEEQLDALRWNALDTTIELIDVMRMLCEGATYAEVNPHDDEWPTLFVRDKNDQVRYCSGNAVLEEISLPLATLAPLVLREGRKLSVFLGRIQAMLDERIHAGNPDKATIKALHDRQQLLAAFDLGKRLAKLEASIALLAQPRPIVRDWSGLTSLLVEFPSSIDRTFTKAKHHHLYHTVIHWEHLPEAEIAQLTQLVTHTAHSTELRFRLPEHGYHDAFYWLEFQVEGSKVRLSFSSHPPEKPKQSRR